jgi:hypothetical protein
MEFVREKRKWRRGSLKALNSVLAEYWDELRKLPFSERLTNFQNLTLLNPDFDPRPETWAVPHPWTSAR